MKPPKPLLTKADLFLDKQTQDRLKRDNVHGTDGLQNQRRSPNTHPKLKMCFKTTLDHRRSNTLLIIIQVFTIKS